MPVSQPPPSWGKITGKPTTVAGFGITDLAAQVAAAEAAQTAGGVGSYAFMYSAAGGSTFGATLAGSSLFPVGSVKQIVGAGAVYMFTIGNGTAQAGTWRCMGHQSSGGDANGNTVGALATLWLRIS